ncbi:MAG: mannitol dehydrogenase family protein [Bifidobacteriaceae bacterium]|nr:mannitol dehydrogenase family protein [Bifidobacteriaceae bacterium]
MPALAMPRYDRTAVSPGIVHLGVGAFHRAHQAYYLDELMAQGEARGWGILGVGIMPEDAAMRDALTAQDGLYTVIVKAPSGAWRARVIGSMVGYLYGPDDPARVVAAMADPAIRIVSLTITEGGYNFDQVTGQFIEDEPGVAAEVAGGAPTTVFGYLYSSLCRRKALGIRPFTVMSCDNIQDNGAVARRALIAYAKLRDEAMADWIAVHVHFPSSMVDRITPRTTQQDIIDCRERYGVDDRCPVVTEEFTQWVLLDDFPTGRPPYERVGVQLVGDVEPYELMKLRLLNASHQGLAYFAHLAGYGLVHEAAQDPLIAAFLTAYMDQEASPTLRPVPGVDLAAYKRTLIDRFSNEQVRDTVARLAAESSDRIPKWLLPVVRDQLRDGGQVRLSAAIVASWARYAEGVDESGQPITIVDNAEDQVRAAARAQESDPLAFLRQERFFGDLIDYPSFTTPYLDTLDSLHRIGSSATLRNLVT